MKPKKTPIPRFPDYKSQIALENGDAPEKPGIYRDRNVKKRARQHLDPKRKKFCDEYLKTGNAAHSARIAGYTSRNYSYILDIPIIKSYLAKCSSEFLQPKITKDWYISKLSQVIDQGIPDIEISKDERIYTTKEALEAGDQVCKILGFYAPDQHLNVNTNLDTYKELLAKIKSKKKSY